MKVFIAYRKQVQQLRANGIKYEDAVLQAAEQIEINENHPAFNDMKDGYIHVHDGNLMAPTKEKLLQD